MKRHLLPFVFAFAVLFPNPLRAQIPAPEEVFGFRVGADYKLARYDQMLTYYDKLVASSDRIRMIDIGRSVMGRPIKLFFISSAANLQQLDKWRSISEQLARARISPQEARQLAQQGKAVVWIDGGMHAREAAHAQMTSELAWRLVSEESPEMQKIRDNVIILLCPVINPDGLEIVATWYERNLGTPWETTDPPILYQKYVGHDNNRDWFMNNMPETRAATHVLYREWYPQIVHNHHQTSPAWARIFLPPFRSPVNPRIHPGVTTGVNLVGTAMAERFAMKKMPGVISGTNFSMWWNGGMRTAPYFHNMIGILTEVAHRTPTPRYYDPDSIPKSVAGRATNGTEVFYPYPWRGGESHFRDAVDYMITASMGILDFAADRREDLLYNIYRMGRDAIEKTGDNTVYAYIFSPNQWDSGEARNLANILLLGGVEVHRATKKFKAGDKEYPAGTLIAYGAQAFRPFLEDLMEKQEYPNQYRYPGGPPMPPYDLAGWTLPMQMGVVIDRITEPFEAKTEPVDTVVAEAGRVIGKGEAGYLWWPRQNNSYTAMNRLKQAGLTVYRLQQPYRQGKLTHPAGSFWVADTAGAASRVNELATELGLDFYRLAQRPGAQSKPLPAIKVGIYKSWVANIDEGWTRWMLLQHGFAVDTLHDADMHSRDLSAYTAIIIPSQSPQRILNGHAPGTMPPEYTGGMGLEGAYRLKKYVEQGATLITLDAASDFAIAQFGLPVQNVVAGTRPNQFFIPGSLVRVKVDTTQAVAYGMQREIAASFARSRAFKTVVKSQKGEGGREDIQAPPRPEVKVVARYADRDILMSGWALGQNRYLKNKGAVMEVKLGNGRVVLFGFRPQFRGQPRASYKLLFNAILLTNDKQEQ